MADASIPIKTSEDFEADLKADTLFGAYRITEQQYRPAPGHNWSSIKHMRKSANSYKKHLSLKTDSPDMQTGRIFHTIVLEPEKLESQYITPPATYPATPKKKGDPPKDSKWTYNAGYCKTWRSQMEEEGLEVVTEKQMQEAHELARAVLQRRWLQQAILDALAVEIAIFWLDYSSGLLCKAKLDILLPSGFIVDLKSWNVKLDGRSELDAAGAEAYFSGHHCQAAFYRDGLDRVMESYNKKPEEEGLVIFAYVDKTPEHDTAILGMSNFESYPGVYPWIAGGRAVYTALLHRIARCEETDEWPSTFMGDDGHGDMQLFYVPEFLDKRLAVTE